MPKGKYCVYPRMVYRPLQAGHCDAPPPPILDDRKSPSIAFLDISDQYTIFLINVFTKWPPAAILDYRKSLSIAFLTISDQCATAIFFKFCSQSGCRRPFWMTENHFWSLFFHKMAAGGHFAWPKITFDCISRHFRSIHNFYFFHKIAAWHFGWPKITFDRISRHFRSMRKFDFFSQNGWRRPFWMTNNHFRSHISSFQINTQL